MSSSNQRCKTQVSSSLSELKEAREHLSSMEEKYNVIDVGLSASSDESLSCAKKMMLTPRPRQVMTSAKTVISNLLGTMPATVLHQRRSEPSPIR